VQLCQHRVAVAQAVAPTATVQSEQSHVAAASPVGEPHSMSMLFLVPPVGCRLPVT
jgi:hypothetical protein